MAFLEGIRPVAVVPHTVSDVPHSARWFWSLGESHQPLYTCALEIKPRRNSSFWHRWSCMGGFNLQFKLSP
eukprot:scaffold250322_cov52-Prasinocladus_malaysianus.AAC.1